MKAYTLKLNDKEKDIYHLAWLVHVAGATENKGNKRVPKYKHFNDFYDHQRIERKILNKETEEEIIEKQKRNSIKNLMININERGEN
mgnify:FL=1